MSDSTVEFVRTMLSDRAPQTLADPALMDSAVLLLLYPKDGEYCVLFNKRTDEVEFNKGDICFPGGAKDAEDADFAFTARREAHEEMGIHPEDVTILGELNEASTRAGFRIHPFVGTIPYPYQFEPSSAEVAAVLEVPLSTLLDPANIIDGERHRPDGTSEPTRSYAYEDHLIVGATARIVRQFLDLLEQSGWTKEE